MKISVVMATYQGEKYLREQLDTIRLQTRRADEVILCDDCSGDATVEIAEQYIREYRLEAEWRILVNEKNLGYANNFHRAASLATGEYLFFADQDDLWKPEKIEKMVGVMEAHPDCMVLCTDYEPFYEEGKVSGAAKKALERMPDDGSLEKVELSERSVYIGALGCCMCVRGSFYRGIQDYWFEGWRRTTGCGGCPSARTGAIYGTAIWSGTGYMMEIRQLMENIIRWRKGSGCLLQCGTQMLSCRKCSKIREKQRKVS